MGQQVASNTFGPQVANTGPLAVTSGRIIRDYGEPLSLIGDIGAVYMDVSGNPNLIYVKRRSAGNPRPWGNWMLQAPSFAAATLKWYGDTLPSDDLGAVGDYFLLFGVYTSSVFPNLLGPKTAGGWPERGAAPAELQAQITTCTFIGLGGQEDAGGNPVYMGQGGVTVEGVIDEAPVFDGVDSTSIVPVGLPSLGQAFPGGLGAFNLDYNSDFQRGLTVLNPLWDSFCDMPDAPVFITTSGDVVPTPAEQVLLINKTANEATNIDLPLAELRFGLPIRVYDWKGDAATNHINFVVAGTQIIKGPTSIVTNNGTYKLNPVSGIGWYVTP